MFVSTAMPSDRPRGATRTLQLAHPAVLLARVRVYHNSLLLPLPGFFALQSAQVAFPGTVLISSCSARSLRACWRLFSADAMSEGREGSGASHKELAALARRRERA